MLQANCIFVLFLVLFSPAASIEDETEEVNLTVFNKTLVESFEKQISILHPTQYTRFISRLGKIALFARLTRQYARSPNVGVVDFEHYFPKPELPFHKKLYSRCKVDIVGCVDFIFENLQSRASFLFPVKGMFLEDFKISEDSFNRQMANSLFQFDVSITYLFCYLARNQFVALNQLPYYSYGTVNGTKQTWPADRYKELSERSELYIEFGEEIEPIDELTNQKPFQCAEKSFCPDPCCGFQTNASTCSHQICRNATAEMLCFLKSELNSELTGMVANQWNISCNCPPGQVFRFDVERCIDHDECVAEEDDKRRYCLAEDHKECVNTQNDSICQCQMGYVLDKKTNSCMPLQLVAFNYAGPAVAFNQSAQ
ncbi:Hemicentin-2 [Aphelenchoides bicaudatus]|nr:Hemicentin-2 [Aphelenchoides bicaudatus]